MSWTDEEIDRIAREGAANSTFEYRSDYFKDIEAFLPVSRKKDFLWFFTAFTFVGLILTSMFVNTINPKNESSIAQTNDTINKSKSITTVTDRTNGVSAKLKPEEENSSKDPSNSETTDQDKSLKNQPTNKKGFNSIQSNSLFSENATNQSIKGATAQPSEISNKLVSNRLSAVDEPVQLSHEQEGQLISYKEKISMVDNDNLAEADVNSLARKPLVRDNVNIELQELTLGMHNQRFPASTNMYVELLGGASQSLISPSNKWSNSFGVGVGMQIQKGRWSITTGVNGVWSKQRDLNLTRQAKVYGFGSDEYKYQFKYKEIYSLEAELSIGYKLKRHNFNLGVRPSYVIGTKVGVIEEVNQKGTKDRMEYGYVDGLNRFGIKPMIGYSYDINSSLKIGLNIGVQMMPMVKNDFLEGVSNKFPMDGRLYLRKSLRFRK